MRRLSLAMVVVLGSVGGCVSANEVVCSDGTICPAGTECRDVGRLVCATPDQLAQCASGEVTCSYGAASGACHGGVCLPIACGNGLVDPGEMCDIGDTEPGNGCSADCRSTETCRNGVLDPDTEQCDDGNGQSHDGCSSTCVAEAPRWTNLAETRFTNERPLGLFEVSLAYDSKRQRVVMFGGNAPDFEFIVQNQTREWDGTRWARRAVDVAPQPRQDCQIAYHAGTGKTVMFSGDEGNADTWLWDGVQWTTASPTTIPPPRTFATITYDSKRDRIVMFGGSGSLSGSALADTWEWTGADWQRVSTATSPPARTHAQMAYDPMRDRTVLYGGTGLSDLWEYDGTTWHPVTFSGGPGVRAQGAMAFDPISKHVILIGGGAANPSDVWDWDGTSWTLRPSPFPDQLGDATGNGITTDVVRGRVVVWHTSGIYELAGTQWVHPTGGEPHQDFPYSGYYNATFVMDPLRRRVLAFGGRGYFDDDRNDLALWDGAWSDNIAVPAAITKRYGATGAFDRKRGQAVIFGGCASTSTFYSDTWTFDTTPHALAPVGVPLQRCHHAMAYDALHEDVVMFGGLAPSGPLDDTYAWDGQTWTIATPAHRPPALYGAAMAYDEDHHVTVLFGGHGTGATQSDATWIWDGTDWTQAMPALRPPARYFASMAWDYDRHRLVLYGGIDAAGIGQLGDVWEWDGASWALVPTQGKGTMDSFGMTSGWDGGVLVFHGRKTDEIWRLRYEGATPYETCSTADADSDGTVGCSDSDCAFECLPCGDGTCDPEVETCGSCPADCGACPAP